MADQIIKNDKFRRDVNCRGILQMNPYLRLDNVQLLKQYYTDEIVGAITTYIPLAKTNVSAEELGLIGTYDAVLIGGQTAGYVNSWGEASQDYWELQLIMPYGTYLLKDETTHWVSDPPMEKEWDTLYFFKRYLNTADYNCAFWYSDGGQPIAIGCNSDPAWDDPNVFKQVEISSYGVTRVQSLYGHHGKVFNSANKYVVKISLPFSTPIEKIQQLLQSEAVMLQMDDRSTTDYDNQNNWKIVKPLGGGCVSPVQRKVTISSSTLRQNIRRERYEIDGILEG